MAIKSVQNLPGRSQAGPRWLCCHFPLAQQHPQSQMLPHSGLQKQTLLQSAAAAALAFGAAAAVAAGDAAHAAVQWQRGRMRRVEPTEQQHSLWAGPTQPHLQLYCLKEQNPGKQPEHCQQGQLEAQGWLVQPLTRLASCTQQPQRKLHRKLQGELHVGCAVSACQLYLGQQQRLHLLHCSGLSCQRILVWQISPSCETIEACVLRCIHTEGTCTNTDTICEHTCVI